MRSTKSFYASRVSSFHGESNHSCGPFHFTKGLNPVETDTGQFYAVYPHIDAPRPARRIVEIPTKSKLRHLCKKLTGPGFSEKVMTLFDPESMGWALCEIEGPRL